MNKHASADTIPLGERSAIAKAVRDELDRFEALDNPDPFHWPDDGLGSRPWYYAVHCSWVRAWNAENRATPCVQLLRQWLANWEAQKP